MEKPGLVPGGGLGLLNSSGSGGGLGSFCKISTSNMMDKVMSSSGGSPDSTTTQKAEDLRSSSGGGGSAGSGGGGVPSPGPSSDGSGPNAPNMYSLKWNTQLLSLQRSLANLWDSGIGTDAVLLCQGTPLPVHKIVLTAASPYVASVVQTMAQGAHMMPVIVVDIPPEAGKALLSFLYCGEAHVPVTVIPHLVLGAKFLGISGFGDPGVLESLTSIVPESVMTPDKTPPPSCDSPRPDHHHNSSHHSSSHPHHSDAHHHRGSSSSSPYTGLNQLPSHLMSNSSVQINNAYGGLGKKSASEASYPGNLLQFKSHSHLSQMMAQAQVANNKQTRLPYGSPYSTSSTTSSTSSGEIINLSKNRTSGGTAYSPASNYSSRAKSPKSSASSSSGIGSGGTNGSGLFIGTTSILDNLLKNPRTPLEAAIAAAAAAHHTLVAAAAEGNDNSDMVQYEAEGYLENCRSPHNLSVGGRSGGDQPPSYFCSPGSAGHPALLGSGPGNDDDNNNNMEMTMTEDNTPIPPHLLEPKLEYNTNDGGAGVYQDRLSQNPLDHLAKVASARPPAGGGNKRGSRKNQQQMVVDGNGEISSSGHGARATPPPKPKPKKNEAIICDICGKKFSNAYNLRVHMEGHSGQVFVCSVCSHASRSRDALRKHFAYRHRELWISGMSAFRKNVPGRKMSICRNNNNTDVLNNNTNAQNNNNTVLSTGGVVVKGESGGGVNEGSNTGNGNSIVDANGNINLRGTDGTLTISEAKVN